MRSARCSTQPLGHPATLWKKGRERKEKAQYNKSTPVIITQVVDVQFNNLLDTPVTSKFQNESAKTSHFPL